jgi:hypothetical protein
VNSLEELRSTDDILYYSYDKRAALFLDYTFLDVSIVALIKQESSRNDRKFRSSTEQETLRVLERLMRGKRGFNEAIYGGSIKSIIG